VSVGGKVENHKDYLGTIEQLNEVIEIYKINEVIFCSKDISSQVIIDYMNKLVSFNIDFKIAPQESLSIIGSNSIDTAGDLYIIDVNSINKPKNKRNKRVIDISMSLICLATSPVLILIQEQKANFIKNIFAVLFGFKSWVGYSSQTNEQLPKLKPSVLSPADGITNIVINDDTRNRLNLTYSKDYRVENDLNLMWKAKRKLGN
jgi:hypothetical protein